MKKVRKISKKFYLRQIMACWLASFMAFGIPAQVVMAADLRLPSGEVVLPGGGGVGDFDRSITGELHIMDVADQTIIEWDSFDIGSSALTEFHQLGIDPAVLNRITGEGPASEIFGKLYANGRIFIINPAGIVFGGGASVNVAQLVASSLDIDNADFRNGLPYTFTGGATAGDVINEGSRTITAEQIALIGKTVINRGALVADDYVIMAAGETVVLQADPGVSNIAVVVTMPVQDPGNYDYIVDQGGSQGTGDGTIVADHVILAAGDIWSTAISGVETLRAEAKGNAVFKGEIYAYAENASDAVADVTIITGGDFTVDYQIMAEAEATGGGDNAFATVTIESTGGNVTVDEYVKAEADAEDSAGNATATVDITADGSVTINDKGASPQEGEYVVKADAWVDEDSGDATANLTITAGVDVDIYDDVSAQADTRDNSGDAISRAEINADGDVYTDDQFKARSEARYSGNATADTKITGEYIEINGKTVARAITDNSGDAVGNIVIAARGDVDIYSDVKSKVTSIESGDATSDIKISGVNIYIDSMITSRAIAGADYIDDDPSGNSGDATAGIDIAASGIVTVDDRVKSHADAVYNSGSAEATTKIVGTEINIYDGEDEDESESVVARAHTWENSGNATANVEIEATTGNVLIETYGYHVKAEAEVENPDIEYTGDADAGVKITAAGDIDIYDMVKAEADAENNAGDATTTVDITADGSVTIHNGEWDYMVQSDVWVNNNSGSGEATLNIKALGGDVEIYGDVKAEAETSENSGNATATLNINASGDVLIEENEGDTVKVVASVENSDTNFEGDATANLSITAGGNVNINDYVNAKANTKYGSGDADATIDITADGSVNIYSRVKATVKAKDGSGDATSRIGITAGTDVTIDTDGEEVLAEAETEADETDFGSGDAAATIDIVAGGDVDIINGKVKTKVKVEYDSGDATAVTRITGENINIDDYVNAKANTKYDSGNADATVEITARESLTVDDRVQATAKAKDGSGDADATVTITAGLDILLSDEVYADADTEADETDFGSGDATATLTINAGRDLTIEDNDVEAYADALDSGNADATVNLTAIGNVEIYDKVEAFSHAREGAGSATSTINVIAGEDIYIDAEIKAGGAHTNDLAGPANANLTLDAGGNVTITEFGKLKADSHANDNSESASTTVDIDAGGYVDIDGKIEAKAHANDDADDATVLVSIDAGGNVTVDREIKVDAHANDDAGNAAATLTITAGGDFTVDDDTVGVKARADNDAGDATAALTVVAANVTVTDGGEIRAEAETDEDSGNATATVDITTTSSNVIVEGESVIEAIAEVDNNGGPEGSSSSATAKVDIDTGNVFVEQGSEISADADVDNYDNWQLNTFTGNADADVDITASGVVIVDGLVRAEADVYNRDGYEGGEEQEGFPGDIYSGSSYANVTIDNIGLGLGLGVIVGPDGEIIADSQIINFDYPDPRYENNVYSGDAYAGIDIQTCDDVIVDGLLSSVADIWLLYDADPTNDDYSNDTYADVIVKAFGDVIVNSGADEDENGQIEAVASNGVENSASITILAVGDVIVNNGSQSGRQGPFINSREEIRAAAYGDSGSTNNAFVGIATRDGFGGNVEVSGQIGARTWIEGIPGSSNTSTVEIYADQDLIVYGGSADIEYKDVEGIQYQIVDAEEGGQIIAAARNGSINTANVDIYADRDVIVHGAELNFTDVGEGELNGNGGGLHDGGQILALTWGWGRDNQNGGDLAENTSSIGIYAQRDVTIHGTTIIGDPVDIENGGPANRTTDGQVLAGAHGEIAMNDADIVIGGQDDVTIDGEVIAEAGTDQNPLNEHYADIEIWAGDQLGGSGRIYAEADEVADVSEASITFFVTNSGNLVFDGEAYSRDGDEIDEDPIIVVGPVDVPEVSDDFDWIDWLWCEDCEPPVYPLAGAVSSEIWTRELIMTLQGCPVEIEAAANELGITPGAMQVSIGNALALNPTLQACDACATLIDAALVLRDEDGSRMAAMTQMFNNMAPASAPYTPEMQALIATAFAGAAEGSQYATVMEYTDAFVRYYSVLETDLASPVGDSLAFVMGKYGAGVLGSDNNNIAAFVATRLETGETFGD